MNFNLVERSQEDIDKETKELFEEVKPSLDKGHNLYSAVKELKKVRYVRTHCAWYRRLEEYCKEQGYE